MNAVILEVRLPADQLEELAERIAKKMGGGALPEAALDLKEAAGMLGISQATLRRRIDEGKVQRVRGIGCLRVARSEMRRLMGEGEGHGS